jgi:selenocysteine-specific translation elongation factor
MLVSNKIDIQEPNQKFVEQIKEGIKNFLNQEGLGLTRVDAISTSCKTKEGITELRNRIVDWIAVTGKKNAPFPPQQ